MDWNNDGYTDLIVGDRDGFINYFQRNSDGTLQSGVKLLSGGITLDAGANSAPDFVDWDNDGDLDMIVGTDTTAPVRFYENTGTASVYQFDGFVNFIAGGSSVTLYRSMPSIYDMNGDGLFDIVMGATDKKFHYFENTGTSGSPSFAAAVQLQYQSGGAAVTEASDSRLDLCDWNEDGHIDFVAGDYNQNTYLFFANDGTGIEGGYSGITVPSAFSLNGNPVAGTLSMNINLGEASSPMFTVYTMNGRTVLSHNAGTLDAGNNNVLIPIDLPSGAYMVRCDTGNIALTERFVVVR